MTEIADRYRNVAEQFTQRVTAVSAEAWSNPTPCEGWAARDVIRHMVEVADYFLGRAGGGAVDAPSADEDPVGAWFAVRDTVQAALDAPELAGQEYDTPMGRMSLEQAVARVGIADVLIHTWDLARAAGLDDALDPEEVHRTLTAMEPFDEMMRSGTAFGPRVDVADDADEQARLIAFTGRRP